ncbi:MAG: tol-pal system protein YbgF [Acidobacteriota bacterium]
MSSTEIKSIQSQLSDIQIQVLELRKEGSTRDQLTAAQTSLEDRLEGLLQSQADFRSDVRALSEQVEQLQAKIEDTNFRLAKLSQQISATNEELRDIRDVAEEAKASADHRRQAPTVEPTVGETSSSQDPEAMYDAAYDHYQAGNYELAADGFRTFLDRHPETDLADNASYWLGECFYRQNKFQKAIEQYDTVLTQYPGSDRIASALVRKGYAYLELGQPAQGIVQLQNVICEHPETDEAHVARQRLEELGIDLQC